MKNFGRKIRGINDRSLDAALTNHADVLRALTRVSTTLLRERRLLLFLQAVEVGVIVGLLWGTL